MTGIPRKYLIAAIIWAIIGAIGFLMVILASSPPWVLNLGEMVGLLGMLGSWITVLTGATIGGQVETIKLQREMIGLQEKTLGLQEETLKLLKEFRDETSSSFKEMRDLLSIERSR